MSIWGIFIFLMDCTRTTERLAAFFAAGLMISAAAVAAAQTAAQKEPARRPNIVLILADDLGFSDIGCYGSEIPTPNIDKLAAGGVRFRQFYNTARCCPSRASLLTGLYAHEAGIGHMMGGPDKYIGYADGLTSDCVTLAEVLGLGGYSTYMSGKWHVSRYAGPKGPRNNWPMQRGFDKFYGTLDGFGSFWDPGSLCRGNTFISPFADADYKPAGQYYYTTAIADNAISFLDEHRREAPDNPYFLYLAFTAPHWPMHASEEDIARFKGKYDGGYDPIRRERMRRLAELGLFKDQVPAPTIGDWDDVKHKEWEARCMEVYAAMIYRMDQEIGKFIANLQQAGELDNTLIVFLSDNGACPEDVGRQPSAPYEKYKPMKDTDLQRKVWPPMQTRDGQAVKTGTDAMPGPVDSFAAYGENWANVSDTPFRLYKHYVHEGGISTPCIVHWPAAIPAGKNGSIVDGPGHIIDLMPTFVDAAQTSYPETYHGHKILPEEGVSLLPVLRGEGEIDRSEPLFWEHESNRAVRRGKWKLVNIDGQPWELYYISKDRGEMHNLAGEHPELVKELAGLWQQWAARTRVLPLDAWKEDGTPPEPIAKQTTFTLHAGDMLSRAEGPVIGGKKFTVTAKIDEWGRDGVIISQGEEKNGFALFAMNGKAYFVMRWKHEFVRVETEEPLTSGPHTLGAAVGEEGRMTLAVDGKVEARRRPPGFILHTPIHGVQVGNDVNGLVAPAQKNKAFNGKISEVVVEVQD